MTFAPLLPATGVVGLRLLDQTAASQRAVFDKQPEISRATTYFEANISKVDSAEALVADRRLMQVALGAFGLDDEIDKTAFLRRILEDGSENPDALANRLVDPRYKKFARAFGFGDFLGARTAEPGFGASISADYRTRQFEIAVGDQDQSLRLALNFRREIAQYAGSSDPEGAAWFSVMGDKPVREVVEGAFGLPGSFGQIDINRQRDTLQDINSRIFGSRSLEVFSEPENVNKMIDRFLARRSIDAGPSASTPGFAALAILGARNTGLGAAGSANLLASSL